MKLSITAESIFSTLGVISAAAMLIALGIDFGAKTEHVKYIKDYESLNKEAKELKSRVDSIVINSESYKKNKTKLIEIKNGN